MTHIKQKPAIIAKCDFSISQLLLVVNTQGGLSFWWHLEFKHFDVHSWVVITETELCADLLGLKQIQSIDRSIVKDFSQVAAWFLYF